ncbi:N-acetyltransferase [Mycetocola tolaasinivorans]|uniref:N-acetyltransferase n=1 Tax=Mycetocola tolaasinivorans TaxID=76635 RepID=A0A3L7A011_9MICO|nr:GNAT family protein [Mycetocola tolaasinivorans]RLP72782.1 N-acetyltransferase [Mycetocola tolaasinivorans]
MDIENVIPAHYLPLTTERLTLRFFTAEDAEAHLAYQGRAEVAEYLYRAPLSAPESSEAVNRAAAARRWAESGDSLTLAILHDGLLIGEVPLTLTGARARQVEIGWVFSPEVRGRGFAVEAARAALDLAFTRLGAHRVFARLDTRNLGSVRVCERLGLRREAHLIDNDQTPDGAWGSEYVYALTRPEYPTP